MTDLERVARAISVQFFAKARKWDEEAGLKCSFPKDGEDWEKWVDVARAAIEALMEPSVEVCRAGNEALAGHANTVGMGTWGNPAHICVNATLRAVLEEK